MNRAILSTTTLILLCLQYNTTAQSNSQWQELERARLSAGAKSVLIPVVRPSPVKPVFDQKNFSQEMKTFNKNYREMKDRMETNQSLLKFSGWTMRGGTVATSIALAAATEGVSIPFQIMVGLTGWGLENGIENSVDYLVESGNQSADEAMRGYLSRLSEQSLKEWEKLEQLDGDARVNAAREMVSSWAKESTKDIEDSKERAQVEAGFNTFMVRSLTNALAKEGSIRKLADENLQAQIYIQSAQVRNVVRTLTNLETETGKRLDSLSHSMIKFQNSLQSLNSTMGKIDLKIDSLTDDVSFIKDYAFSKMTPKEQLAALNSKAFAKKFKDNPAELARLKQKIQTLADYQDFSDKAQTFLAGSDLVLDLASKFGVSPKVVNKGKKIVALASGAVELGGAIVSGNPMSAISAIGKCLGVFGGDAAAKRHAQIMNALSKISEGINVTIKLQQATLQGLQTIVQNQELTLKAIMQLHQDMIEIHERTMTKLVTIHQDILINRELVTAVLQKDIHSCAAYLDTRIAADGFSAEKNIFSSFEDLRTYHNSVADLWNKCLAGFDQNFLSRKTAAASFRLAAYDKGESVNFAQFEREKFVPLRDYALQRTAELAKEERRSSKVRWALMDAASQPLPTMGRSSEKISDALSKLDIAKKSPADLDLVFQNLWSIDHIIEFSQHLVSLYPLIELTNGSGVIEELSTIISKKDFNARGLLNLKGALGWIFRGIAQETMMAGEPILDFMVEDYLSSDKERASIRDQVIAILEGNSLIARNFVARLVQVALKNSKTSSRTYDLALNDTVSDAFLKMHLTGKDFAFELKEVDGVKAWHVVLSKKVVVRLPTAEEVQSGQIEYPESLSKLLQARSKVATAITNFKFLQDATTNENRTAFYWFWANGRSL